MSESLLEAASGRVLVGDGAMGTQLQAAGLEPGGCAEAWNPAATSMRSTSPSWSSPEASG